MITRNISNVRMCEMKFKNTNIQVITYDLNEKDKNDYVVSRVFIEGNDQTNICSCSKSRSEDHNKRLRSAIRGAISYVKLFDESNELEIDSFLEEVELRLRLVMPNSSDSKRMWGMMEGVINYNNKKYYAISYHTSASSVRSFVLREDGLKMEGFDTIHYERAVSDAIIRGERINKVDFKTRFWEEDKEDYGNVIIDDDYEKENERIEKLKIDLKKLEDDISKQMKIVFYADSKVYWSYV